MSGAPEKAVLLGVLGFPLGHTRSPAIQNAALRALGLDWRYLKLPVPPERFAETTRALPGSGFRGANVTVPHKQAALALADRPSSTAAAIGAANTLTFADGSVAAENTDAGGFLDALGAPPAGLRALVLGAGGSARAVAWALREAGAAEVSIWNRTGERARELALALELRAVAQPEPADLVVNATTVGLDPAMARRDASAALGLDRLPPPSIAVDLVYGSRTTPVCAWASEAGARVVDGLEVLVAQGARSLEIWTGRKAPREVMRAAARAPDPASTPE